MAKWVRVEPGCPRGCAFAQYSLDQASKLLLLGSVALASLFPMPALAGIVVNLTCDNGARVQIRELYPQSTHRYVLGDLIEVRMWGERYEGEPYRVGAAPTASFGGRWVYLGNADDSLSVLRSSRSEFWWVDREDLGKWTCVETK
jgi:hypothetical protein